MLVYTQETFNCENSDIWCEYLGLIEKLTFVKKPDDELNEYITKMSPEEYLKQMWWSWLKKYRNQFKITIFPESTILKIRNEVFNIDDVWCNLGEVIDLDFKKIEINILPNDYNIQIDDDIFISDMWQSFNVFFQEESEKLFKLNHPNVDFSDMKDYNLIFPEIEECKFISDVSTIAFEHLSYVLYNAATCGFDDALERLKDDFDNKI